MKRRQAKKLDAKPLAILPSKAIPKVEPLKDTPHKCMFIPKTFAMVSVTPGN